MPPDFAAEGLLDGLEGDRPRRPRAPPRAARRRRRPARGAAPRAPSTGSSCCPPSGVIGGARATPPARSPSAPASSRVPRRAAPRAGPADPGPRRAAPTPRPTSRPPAWPSRAARPGIPDEDMLELMRVLGRGLSQAAEACARSRSNTRARAGHQRARARPALRARGRAALRRSLDPLLEHTAHPAPAPRDPQRGDQRRRARGRRAARARARWPSLRRPRRLHAPRRGSAAGRARRRRRPPRSARRRRRRRRRCGSSRRSATPRCSSRPSREPLLDATLALVDAADAEGEDFPQLRAGVALGGGAQPRAATGSGARSTSPAASPTSRAPAACWPPRSCATPSARTACAGRSPARSA